MTGMEVSPDHLFTWAGNLAIAGWLILIFAPRRGAAAWRWLFGLARYGLPLVLALLYSGLVLTQMARADGGYGSLAAVRLLFSNDYLLLAGWVHYLAFDLFVGGWIAQQADQMGLHRFLQPVILVLTFLVGPVGLAIFLVVRQLRNPSQPSPAP